MGVAGMESGMLWKIDQIAAEQNCLATKFFLCLITYFLPNCYFAAYTYLHPSED